MEFKKGDIVGDKEYIKRNHIYSYGLVEFVKGPEVWCYWARTLDDLKNKRYSSPSTLWCAKDRLHLVKEKIVDKRYGIAKFLGDMKK